MKLGPFEIGDPDEESLKPPSLRRALIGVAVVGGIYLIVGVSAPEFAAEVFLVPLAAVALILLNWAVGTAFSAALRRIFKKDGQA